MTQYCNKLMITPFPPSFDCKLVAIPEFGKASKIARTKLHCYSDSKTNTSTNSNRVAKTCLKKCLRCNTLYDPLHNSPTACSFHAHITGEKGLFALAPPHQGIDGEWTDRSGVIVYKWNEKDNRPNTGSANWKKRWSCCSEYDENAPPCGKGWHVSYDDGFTMY